MAAADLLLACWALGDDDEDAGSGGVMMSRLRLGRYVWWYRIGVGLGLAVAVSPLLGLRVPALSLLAVGVSVVVVLAALALLTPTQDRAVVGNKVQTAGYLYTLIGFSTLLILIGKSDPFRMADAIGPLGSALLTSILGWFLGGEIIEQSGRAAVTIRSETERIASELTGFASAVRSAHEEYVTSIRGLAVSHKSLHESQRKAMLEAVATATELSDHLGTIKKAIADLDSSLSHLSGEIRRVLGPSFEKVLKELVASAQEAEAGLKKTAVAAGDTSQFLQQSRLLVEELKKLLDLVYTVGKPR